ncbi:SH3 domain-containing protein [Cellvibrio zantedeschiae]|uniref:SH3 domain-containing protein n=1 Tax=Cellvibrio zantedeschiae TaxID=1237077 RepID=UPI001E4931D4|nr:SH3 domain-containing protein [Cellvibrio zantedeschiae]
MKISLLKIKTAKHFTRSAKACAYCLGSIWLWSASVLFSVNASAADFWKLDWFAPDVPIEVTVNDAFINVYNAPGRGYPIFHVVERGETITLLKMKTDWIKIKTVRGIEGWIKRGDVLLTLGPDGLAPEFPDTKQADYLVDRFEVGTAFGDFDGADSVSLNLGYRFTKNLSTEIRLAQNTGQYSDSQIAAIAILHQPFPDLRVSPFIGIGAGKLKTMPSTTLVQSEDREDNLLQASLGAYIHITGRFFVRAEYINDYVLTSRNTNEEVNEWKIGFNVFF